MWIRLKIKIYRRGQGMMTLAVPGEKISHSGEKINDVIF